MPHWLVRPRPRGPTAPRAATGLVSIETRFRYNPDVKSLPAMVPAVIPLLLLMIPAILTALSVVREKELGSIVNFYVTPVTRLEFLLGKQVALRRACHDATSCCSRRWPSSCSTCR